jgi:site-specific recombinase XerD
MSLELRRRLYLWLRNGSGVYVFSTRLGVPLSIRNAQRDLTKLCRKAGITGVTCSPHTLRHSFACHYLRKNGNLEYLRRILGHSSILVTQRYLQSIQPEDLQSSHISPLDTKGQ